ncbi:MAG: hypothetical protein ABGZ17_16215 [Planctomycetaceae bacterium]
MTEPSGTSTDSATSVQSSPVANPPCGASSPNHQRTLQVLRSMSPQDKLAQVFKLNERTLQLMRIGLRRRFLDLDDDAFERVYLQARERCHNRTY